MTDDADAHAETLGPDPGHAATVDSAGASARLAALDGTPETIGRYRVLRRLGAGGMGVVYAAHDPELDRTVAIKVVRERHRDGEALQDRLRREAQALARLSHPNVVSIFDVGVEAGRIYIVMQHVDGASLDEWLARHRPPPREVIALFERAGRGLAAAHAAGLIHRDFKPGNVLVDSDGTVRVTDFGLARLSTLGDSEVSLRPAISDGDTPLSQSMTRGDVIGTPAYMSPEQFLAGTITPATDQFGFCVALWEALAGRRPFSGATYEALREAVVTGVIDEAPAGRLTRDVQRALRRGLAVRSADQFSSFDELLDALAPPRGRGRWVAAAAVVTVAGAAALAAVAVNRSRSTSSPCQGADAAIDPVWSPTQRDAVRDALSAIEHPSTAALTSGAISRFDDRASRWRAMRLDACEATRVRRAQPVEVMERRIDCLDRALTGLGAAVEELRGASDAVVLTHALAISTTGVDPAECTAEQVATTPASSGRASPELIAKIAALEIAREAGRWAEVIRTGPAIAQEAEASGDTAAAVQAWWTLSETAPRMTTDMARETLRHTAEVAAAAGADLTAVKALTQAAEIASRAGEVGRVEDLLSMARAAAARAGTDEARLTVDHAVGSIALDGGDRESAIAGCTRVRDDAARLLPEGHVLWIHALQCLTDAYMRIGRWDDALAAAQQVLVSWTKAFGMDHPNVLEQQHRQALVRFRQGERAEARATWAVVLPGLETSAGPVSIDVMNVLSDIALAESEQGNITSPEARAASDRAVALGRRLLPSNDPQLARLLWTHANIVYYDKDLEESASAYAEALAIYERSGDLVHWAQLAYSAADLDRDTGRCDRALPRFARIVELGDGGAVDAPTTAAARGAVGFCQVALGQITEGAATLTRAITELDAAGLVEFAAMNRMWLSDAEHQRGRRKQARKLAQAARDLVTGDNQTHAQLRAEADTRLAR